MQPTSQPLKNDNPEGSSASESPLLTLITPCFNSERFIAQCLQQVAEQWVPGIEHLVMDGASKDSTVDIIRRFAEEHSYIRFVSEPDSGQSNAMNKGIAAAKGRFISFLNVDDKLEPDALPYVMQELAHLTDRHLLVGNCKVEVGDGKMLPLRKPEHCGYPQILEIWRQDVFPPNPVSYYYARHLHELAGMYDEEEHFVLDYEMMVRLLQHAEVKYVNRTLGTFVQHHDTKTFQNTSTSGIISKQHIFDRYAVRQPLLRRWRLKAMFFYHYKLRRSNNPVIFFGLRPLYALRRIAHKLGFSSQQ